MLGAFKKLKTEVLQYIAESWDNLYRQTPTGQSNNIAWIVS